ncbi:MAG: hypothetical protein ACXVXY_07175 [Mycobacteriaceae bacterium]
MSEPRITHRVNRPAPTATWEHRHRWGSNLGDTTELRVTRTGGRLRISYGSTEVVEIRPELLDVFASMVTAALAWTDEVAEASR